MPELYNAIYSSRDPIVQSLKTTSDEELLCRYVTHDRSFKKLIPTAALTQLIDGLTSPHARQKEKAAAASGSAKGRGMGDNPEIASIRASKKARRDWPPQFELDDENVREYLHLKQFLRVYCVVDEIFSFDGVLG